MHSRWKVLFAFALLFSGSAGASHGYDATSYSGCQGAVPGLRLDCTIRVHGSATLEGCEGDVCLVSLEGGATGTTPRATPKSVRVTLDDFGMRLTLCREDEPLVASLACAHDALHRVTLPAGTCVALQLVGRLDAASPGPLPSPRSFADEAILATATLRVDVPVCRA